MSKSDAREEVLDSYKAHQSKMRRKNPNSQLVYDNQREAAMKIVEKFRAGASAVTLLALPQVGKTGVMLYVSYLMTTLINDDELIYPENVFVISGMNETAWQEQTSERFPEALRQNIYTRQNFHTKFKNGDLKNLKDALIIIDECHIAGEHSQQIPSLLAHAELNTPEFLDEKKVKILQVSATPDHTLFNAINKWENKHATVCLEAGPDYIGFKQLLEAGRITDNIGNNMAFVEDDIKEVYTSPKYHICRLGPNDNAEFNAMCRRNGWKKLTHDSNVGLDIDVLFETAPLVHTFILIKGYWRAGKSLNDKHIGIMYEFPTDKPDTTVTAQSLAGRACGNGKQKPGGESPIIYCDINSIRQYLEYFENHESDYTSRNFTQNGRVIRASSSMHSANEYSENIRDRDIIEESFDLLQDARDFAYKNTGLGRNVEEFHKINGYEVSTRLNTKEGLTAADRLTLDKFNKISKGRNISSAKGQPYMIYPVYETLESKTARYYVRCRKLE
jgi:uncharacterized protein YjhX (UPF0386 family)